MNDPIHAWTYLGACNGVEKWTEAAEAQRNCGSEMRRNHLVFTGNGCRSHSLLISNIYPNIHQGCVEGDGDRKSHPGTSLVVFSGECSEEGVIPSPQITDQPRGTRRVVRSSRVGSRTRSSRFVRALDVRCPCLYL